jgi:hypothetical protein
VRLLAQRIECKQPTIDLDGVLRRANFKVVGAEAVHQVAGVVVETRSLFGQPSLEHIGSGTQALEQFALIEGQGINDGVGRACDSDPLEGPGIDLQGIAVDRELIAIGHQQLRPTLRLQPPQRQDALPQAVPSLLVRPVGPEQAAKFVAGVALARIKRQIGQKGPVLLVVKSGLLVRTAPNPETAQQFERDFRHRGHPPLGSAVTDLRPRQPVSHGSMIRLPGIQ